MTITTILSIEERVEAALEQIRPFLHEDGGDIHLINVSDDMIVQVQFSGACTSCSMSNMTFKAGVEQTILKEVPEVVGVVVFKD